MKHRWIPAALALLLGCGAACASPGGAGAASALVTLAALKQGGLARTILGYGVAQPPASASRSITAPTAQIIESVLARPGMQVAAGAPLLQVGPSPRTASMYLQAQAALRAAVRTAAGVRQLYAQHLATNRQLADADKAVADTRANLGALQAEGAQGARTIRAPFDGVVTRVQATPGMLASAGTPLLELARSGEVVLRIGVDATDAGWVGQGDPVRVRAIGGQGQCKGTVAERGAMIDPATGLVPAEIAVPAHCLLVGQSARAEVSAGEIRGYVVPHAAILVDRRGHPYVMQADGLKARKVAVHIAGSQGDRTVIRGSGLQADQPVVVSGNYQLRDGMSLRVAKPGEGQP